MSDREKLALSALIKEGFRTILPSKRHEMAADFCIAYADRRVAEAVEALTKRKLKSPATKEGQAFNRGIASAIIALSPAREGGGLSVAENRRHAPPGHFGDEYDIYPSPPENGGQGDE